MALAFISYLDRACISQAAPMIARDLHFNTIQMGYIFSAFGLTYAAMEIPSGWLIDRFGPRLVLDARGAVLVSFHGGDRLGVELRIDADGPAVVRRRRGGMLPGTRQDIQQLAPDGRARPRRRLESLQRAMGSRRRAAAGGGALRVAGLACFVCPVRSGRGRVGVILLFPVPQSSEPRRRHRRLPAAMGNFLDREAPGLSASSGFVTSTVSTSM